MLPPARIKAAPFQLLGTLRKGNLVWFCQVSPPSQAICTLSSSWRGPPHPLPHTPRHLPIGFSAEPWPQASIPAFHFSWAGSWPWLSTAQFSFLDMTLTEWPFIRPYLCPFICEMREVGQALSKVPFSLDICKALMLLPQKLPPSLLSPWKAFVSHAAASRPVWIIQNWHLLLETDIQ